jgi:hypothetical protein
MASIVYLDVDDEITSAATRIRAAEESRVALVLPYGSRLATSRINFRLLAREAMLRGRRLGIVTPDASTRALAASAGLPVFLTVGEYESSLDLPEDPDAGRPAPRSQALAGDGRDGILAASATVIGGGGAAGARVADGDEVESRPRTRPSDATTRYAPRDRPTDREDHARPATPIGRGGRSAAAGSVALPVARPKRRFLASPGLVVGLGVLALAVVVAGVAGFVFLPNARIALTPLVQTVGPLAFDIDADPNVTGVDPVGGVIPAVRIDIPLRASADFPATGKRVEKAKASGIVRFDSVNTVGPVAIPAGTRVSTLGAIVFATTRGVTVPRAQVNGTTIQHGVVEVGVRAVKDGPDGNVGRGEITQVPDSLSTLQVSVDNPNATTGGKLDEFPQVAQEDVDGALAQLGKELEAQFATAMADPPGLPDGSAAFPETAQLGEAIPTVDPTTLVGQELETFPLEVTATGQVLAVDASPLEQIVRERLTASITEGRDLVEGSLEVAVGSAVVRDGTISFPVTGIAQEIQRIDTNALKASIMGRTRDEALGILAPFGTVELTLWPDWVSSIPTIDQRVELTVAPNDAPRPTAPALPTAAPAAPSADGSPSQPVPSG